MGAKDPNDWVIRLNKPASSLLMPFSSEATRKAGRQLVLLSALTILLSGGIVSLGEGSFAGIKFVPSKIADMVLIAGLACAYFAILYALDLYRDWRAAYYQRMPAWVEYQRLKADVRRSTARVAKADALETRIKLLRQQRDDKYRQLGLDTPRPTYALASDASIEEIEDQLAAREEDSRKLRQAMDAFSDYCRNDGLDALQEEHLALAFDRTYEARAAALLSLIKTTGRLDWFRLITEVVFPVGLGLVAIATALIHAL